MIRINGKNSEFVDVVRRLHRRVGEHRHHVGGTIAIGASQRSAAIEEMRAAFGDQAQRRERVLDDVDVDRLPGGTGRIDEADAHIEATA